jgi:hypothetical protein
MPAGRPPLTITSSFPSPLSKSLRKSTPSTTLAPPWTAESLSTISAHSSCGASGMLIISSPALAPGHPATTAPPPPKLPSTNLSATPFASPSRQSHTSASTWDSPHSTCRLQSPSSAYIAEPTTCPPHPSLPACFASTLPTPLPFLSRGRNAVSTRTTPPAPPLALLYPVPSPSSCYQTQEHRARIRPLPTTYRLRSLASTHPLPTFASIPLLRLRCQGSVLPTHQFLSPTTRRHVPYQLRHCPHCPHNTLGDELHVILACPHRAPQCHLVISALSHLLADYALSRAALTPLQQVSLQESSCFGPCKSFV